MALGLTPCEIVKKDSHALLRIASSWKRVYLKEIANVQNGYAFKSKFFNHNKGLPLIRIRDIKKKRTENLYSGEYSEEFVVNHHDILIGMDGDFYASRWPGKLGLLNQRVCRLKLKSDLYSEKFFFISLQPYLNAIHEETSSVTVKHLSSRTIQNIPLPLPPLPEQRAIVSKIEQLFSSIDHGIANLKQAQEQLKVYRQAVLKKAFEGELTKEWREQQKDLPSADELLKQIKEERENYYQKQLEEWKAAIKEWEENGKEGKKPKKPKKIKQLSDFEQKELSVFPELNSIWSWVKVDKICGHFDTALKAGPFGSSLKKSFYVPSGYKIYGQEQVISGDYKFGDYYVDENKYKELVNCQIAPKDILISLVGTVGKVLILPKDCEKGIINPRLVKITPNSFYNPEFFKYYFESTFLKSLYKAKNHGTTMDVLNLGIIKELPFPLCSKDEQQQIIQEIESRLSVCDKVEESITANLQKAEALKQSILKKAFEGELLTAKELEACRHEPDWEPAEKLLERIKNSKE